VTIAGQSRASVAVDPLASRLPVTVITGALGSGKTTLLRRLLRHPGMNRAAVIINEFGDVGIDHELVAASSEQMTLLSNGCLCCTLRTDLQETLRELFVKRRAGEVIDFDRIFVETTGLADPIPVLHTLQTDALLGAQYRLDGVVTLVDAVNGDGQLDSMPEAVKQAAVADRLVITKTDIADAAAVDRIGRRLKAMNPFAICTSAVDGELDPADLANIGPRSVSARCAELDRWLGSSDSLSSQEGAQRKYLRDRVMGEAPAHDSAIRSFCLWFDKPLTWDALNASLHALTALRGPDLLRLKGIVRVAGEPAPIVIQGAQHVFHPPVALAPGQANEPRSRIVFIVRNIPRESIEALFAAVGALDQLAVASPVESTSS
jgi:G3E family GTPase